MSNQYGGPNPLPSFTPTGQAAITAGVTTANVALGSNASASSWVSSTAYTNGNVVQYNGQQYTATAAAGNAYQLPQGNPTFWTPGPLPRIALVTNYGSVVAFVALGVAGVTVTLANGIAVAPGASIALTLGAATYLAAITPSTTTTLSISTGY